MRILIANDDGIYSPGIAALAEVAAKFGEVRYSRRMSSDLPPDIPLRPCARSPITHGDRGVEAYRVDGTPADCIPRSPPGKWCDRAFGNQSSSNRGNAMWHSGTLAAAKQAVLLGLRGIASARRETRDEPNFDILKPSVAKVLELLLPYRDLVNKTFPMENRRACAGRANPLRHDGKVVPGEDPWDESSSGSPWFRLRARKRVPTVGRSSRGTFL